ncbi:hypothetical protein HY212_02835 [Candidatus Pacearchaeota archaeon]|nr:hypothetical protein [Candidatus Pacearchaeota archaeon]
MRFRIKHKKLRNFLILSFLVLLLINIQLISALFLLLKFGSLTLNSGEKYTVNIPFLGPSKSPIVCGKAQQTDGVLLENINVTVKYKGKAEILAQNITKKDGKFCVTLPEINKSAQFDIYVGYDNSTLTLGNNDYDLNFDNNKVYSKSTDNYVFLSGNIANKDAAIENGRFEIKMGHRVNGTWKYTFGDYQKYSLNIDPNQIYEVPSDELNFTWNTADLEAGEYKFLIKTSFNSQEYTPSVFFNITA